VPAKRLKRKPQRHISPEAIAAFVNDKIARKERDPIISHLADCPRCRKLVSKVVLSQVAVKDPDP